MYSSIARKKCKCGCSRYPTLGYAGYNYGCAPQEIKDKAGSKKDVARKNKNARNAAALKIKKQVRDSEGAEGGLKENWFAERRKQMTGACLFCGGKTEASNDKTFRNSIAHLLPKKDGIGGVPSVKYHPDNWIELCWTGNSCHDNLDHAMITWEMLRDSAEWDIIVEKFKKIYPFVAPQERRFVPELLLQTINNESCQD